MIGNSIGTAQTLQHYAVRVPGKMADPAGLLARVLPELLLEYGRDRRVIVFVKTKSAAAKLSNNSSLERFGARALHGDMSQVILISF